MDLSPQDPRSYAQGQKQVMIELENIVVNDSQIRQMIKDQALALLKTMANQPEGEDTDRWMDKTRLARPVTMEAVRIYGSGSSSPSIVNVNDDTVRSVNASVATEIGFEASFMKNKLTDAERSVQAGRKLLKSLPREVKDEMAKWDKIIALGEVAEREVTTVARLDFERIIDEATMHKGLDQPRPDAMQQAAEEYLAESRDRIDGLKRDYQAITEKDPDRADTLARWAVSERRGTLNKGLSESIQQAAGNDYRKGATTVTTLASITPSVNEWMARAAREYVGPEGHAPGEAPFTQAEIEVASQHALLDAGHDFIEEAVREGRETARREIAEGREEPGKDQVNALVQATHAPEASEPAQDMQARPQMAQDRPRNPRMEISR